jgi:predicted CXXCH cytochrome family protein
MRNASAGKRVLCGGALLVGFALGAAGAWAGSETPVPEDRLLYRDVVGKVIDGAGKPLAGVPVSLLYETAVTDAKGSFRFPKVPINHTAQVSLRVRSREGFIIGCMALDVPVRFYPLAASVDGKVDVQIVEPGSDEVVTLRPKAVAPGDLGRYCSECHDRNPCLETASYQEVIQSGKDLRGIIVAEETLEDFKKKLTQQGLRKETYQKIRYQDSHPDGMNMEVMPKIDLPQYKGLYKKPKDLKLHDGKVVICDTCHTRHLPTEQRQYVIMPFDKGNELCYQCHL